MAWYLENVNLSNLAWNISNRSAGWSVPGKVGSNVKVPSKHGAFWNPNKTFDEGHLSLSMWAAGCNPDGTLPDNEDGRKKVRDNLDRLSSLFGTPNRLLTLRQITGTEMPVINEITNPNLASTLNNGVTLAKNYAVDPTKGSSSTTEISTNHSTNPYLLGSETLDKVVTEDIHPDPLFHQHLDKSKSVVHRGYYSPVSQNTASTNRFFTPNNGFSYITGRPGGKGVFYRSTAITWTGEAHIGDLTFHKIPNPDRGVEFFMSLKLSSNSPATSVNVSVRPAVSLDGMAWTNAPSQTFLINKNTYTWMHIPASSLPAMTGSSTFSVKYHLRIMTPTSWAAGDYFDVEQVAVQEAPAPDNPWRTAMTPSLIFEGSTETSLGTPGVEYEGAFGLSTSAFKPYPAPEWQRVMGTTANTAPYGAAHTLKYGTRGALGFSVYGGTYQTFRRELAQVTQTFTDTKIHGKVLNTSSQSATIRVMERSGAAGSYTYTAVRSLVIPALGSHVFSSTPFTTTAGKTYVLEVVAPSGPGFLPTLEFEYLHVSNGLINTRIPKGALAVSFGTSALAKYTRYAYTSSIVGMAPSAYKVVQGLPQSSSPRYNASGVDWSKVTGGVSSVNGVVKFADVPFSFSPNSTSRGLVIQFRTRIGLPSHIEGTPPASGSVVAKTEFLDSSGTVLRTVTESAATVPSSDWYIISVNQTAQANEVAVRSTLTYDNSASPMAVLKVDQYSVYTDQSGSLYFTGREPLNGSTLQPWQRLRWNGLPFFSTSTLAAAIPSVWTVSGFKGFDSDNTSIQFTGSSLRVQHRAPGGQMYVGFRRGTHAGDFTVSVTPQGGTATPLGTITSATSFVQGYVTIPPGSSYLDFNFTGSPTHKTVRDLFVIGNTGVGVFPVPSAQWVGFTAKNPPNLTFPAHPNAQVPLQSVVVNQDGTTTYQVGSTPGWSWPLIGGGYLPLPTSGQTHSVSSHEVAVNKGYVSVAVVTDLSNDVGSRVTLEIQGASDEQRASGSWSVLASTPITNTAALAETRLQDVAVGDKTRVKIVIKVANTPALGRTGVAGILVGATLTPSPIVLGSSFPGHFVGVLNSTGSSTYQQNIRQAKVEVVEAIDMTSTGLGTIAEFNVNLTIPGAFWEDIYDTTTTLTASGSDVSGLFVVSDFAGATAPMTDLTFTITPVSGSITDLRLEDAASGNFLQYRGPAQSLISINTTTATVQDGAGASLIKNISQVGASTILSLTPYNRGNGEVITSHIDGTPVLRWECNVPIKVVISGRRKYLLA